MPSDRDTNWTARSPVRVRYLLEGTALFGGVKMILEQTDLLGDRGHDVQIVSREPEPEWYSVRSCFVHHESLEAPGLPTPDVTIATFWTTLGPALRGGGAPLHFCQGYEGLYYHDRAQHPDIARARPPLTEPQGSAGKSHSWGGSIRAGE